MGEIWPSTVPYAPRANSLKVDPFREPLKTDMEDGNFRQRPSTSKNIATASFTIKMENAQFEIFKVWVRGTLSSGTLPFTMPIWTGSDYEPRICKFVSRYADDPGRGIRHLITVNIDIENY